jgi:hypothetical protein
MRLLLDIHVSPVVAQQLSREGMDIISLRDWKGGEFRNRSDQLILDAAIEEGRVLITFDVSTIPSLASRFTAAGVHHAGVVLVAEPTFRQGDIGGLIRAIRALLNIEGDADWIDRVHFLRRAAD